MAKALLSRLSLLGPTLLGLTLVVASPAPAQNVHQPPSQSAADPQVQSPATSVRIAAPPLLAPDEAMGQFSAARNQSGANANDGIQRIFANTQFCGSPTTQNPTGCTVVAEPNYSTREFIPWSREYSNQSFGGSPQPPGASLLDLRGGMFVHASRNPYLNPQHGYWVANELNAMFDQMPEKFSPGAHYVNLFLQNTFYSPTSNSAGPSGNRKNTVTNLQVFQVSHSSAQNIAAGVTQESYGTGDALVFNVNDICAGGYIAGGDEGCHAGDNFIGITPQVYFGTCASGCTPGSGAITVKPTAGLGTQGNDRYVIDFSKAVSGQYVPLTAPSAQSNSAAPLIDAIPGNDRTGINAIQVSGVNIARSSFMGTLAGDVMIPGSALTPGTLTIGYRPSFGSLGRGLACVVDGSKFELIDITASTASSFTATFQYDHFSGGLIMQGGNCGQFLEIDADTLVAGGYRSYAGTNTRAMRMLLPVIGSPDGSRLYFTFHSAIGNGYQGVASQSFIQRIASGSRTSATVTATLAGGGLPFNPTGYSVTVSGASDPAFNGTFKVAAAQQAQPANSAYTALTWPQEGGAASFTGGTISVAPTTNAVHLYPGAIVYDVRGANNDISDNKFTLSPNNMPLANGDILEQQPFPAQRVAGWGFNSVGYAFPNPVLGDSANGYSLGGVPQGATVGFRIQNQADAANYIGHGGDKIPPAQAYTAQGHWGVDFAFNAPDPVGGWIPGVGQPQGTAFYLLPTGGKSGYNTRFCLFGSNSCYLFLDDGNKVLSLPQATVLSGPTTQIGSTGTPVHDMNLYATEAITPRPVPPSSCSDQTAPVTGLTKASMVSGLQPPAPLGNLSVTAYSSPTAANTLVLHFCNVASAAATPPPGAYRFMAVY